MVIFLINGYRIKKVNGEDILYLYMDFSSEFARIDKRNNTEIKKKIKNYIKNNKINFKGSMVALVVGGVLIGTITLNKPKYNNSTINSNKIVAIIDDSNIVQDNSEIEKTKDIIEEVVQENVIKEENNNVVNENKNKNNVLYNVASTVNEKNDNYKLEQSSANTSYEQEENTVDNNIYVELYRKNGSVERIELENYIIGVVGAEMPASFNLEALKAQSIVARTYAVNTINKNKRLTDNNSTQNYKTNDELKSMWGNSYNTYYEKIKSAVNSTKGMYLTYNGEIIDAVYHSTSNGYTEDSVYVWGNSKPYLKSVSSDYDNTNKSFLYTMFLSYEDISNKLKNLININTEFNILERNNSGRIVSIEVNGVIYSGVNIRSLLGLRSTDFDIEKTDTGINFITRGYGHGVGMSQYGANGMAKHGSNYRDILLHYYTGVSINSL